MGLQFFHRLPEFEYVRGRHPHIVQLCTGKNVLHVGCVDTGFLETRFASKQLLHTKIEAVAKSQVGVDIDKEGIDLLRSYGYRNVLLVDLTKDALPAFCIPEEGFHVIVLSEVIEHLSNPGLMLDSLYRYCSSDTNLIVSVPNPFSADVLWEIARGIEKVHPDHCAWYTPYTIENMVRRHGFIVNRRLAYTFIGAGDFLFFPKCVRALLNLDQSRPRNPASLLKFYLWSILNERKREGRRIVYVVLRRLLNGFLFSRGPWFSNGFMLEVSKSEENESK